MLIPIPPKKYRLYLILRVALYGAFFATGIALLFSFLFPSQQFTFDFRNPNAAKNTFLDPRTEDFSPIDHGTVPDHHPLIANTGALGYFSTGIITFDLRTNSLKPESVTLSLRKGYRAGFLPEGSPIQTLPAFREMYADTYHGYRNGAIFFIRDNYYQFFDGVLYRFVSSEAFRSSYPESAAVEGTNELLSLFPLSNELIGFRSGSLLSFADGVFVVYGKNEIRPIGNADIFTAIGYAWNDIIPANEEEIGMYTRGKIILPGTLHAPGTLFVEKETRTYFLLGDDMKRHPINNPNLLSFLISRQHPIEISTQSTERTTSCAFKSSLLFRRSYSCDIPLEPLAELPGNDYEFTFSSSKEIKIESLGAVFRRAPTHGNLSAAIGQLKQRLFDRYGNE